MSDVAYEIEEGVAIVTLRRGTSNALAPETRVALMQALRRAAEDDAVKALVLCGEGNVFCSGIDLTEFDTPLQAPWVPELTEAIEICSKPVVAALHGMALGAGFELALAAHARVAQRGCRVALPEVTLGLVPMGGSTQRLPRLVGAQAALELLLSGRAVPAEDARLSGVFDQLTEGPPLSAAMERARALAAMPHPPRTRDVIRGFSDPDAYQKAVSAVLARLPSHSSAEAQVVRCVEAALLLPFDQGLAFETSAFEDRLSADDARAIRHIYTAERRAALPATDDALSAVQNVVVAGAEELVPELSIFCLDQGCSVTILGPDDDTAEDLSARVRAIYDGAVERGRLKPALRDQRLDRLDQTDNQTVLTDADLVFDSGKVPLRRETAKADVIWAAIDGHADPSAVAGAVSVRLYRPAHSARLAEVAVQTPASDAALSRLATLFEAGGRTLLRTTPHSGLLGHRVMGAGLRAALVLAQAGADPMKVDAAARDLGFARGPFEMMDREGLAEVERTLRRVFGAIPEIEFLVARGQAMVRKQTAGQGFYARQGDQVVEDPSLGPWLRDWRQSQPDAPTMLQVDLQVALHSAVVKAAADLIHTKAVERASDIDLCCVKGYGFSRAHGGPLLQADLKGLLGLVRGMRMLAPLSQDLWGPQPLLDEMVKFGRRFF